MAPLPSPAASRWSARVSVDVDELRTLSSGWSAARCQPGEHPDATGIDALAWMPARVPGTAAAALADAGSWQLGEPHDFDGEDWWFRTSFDAERASDGEELRLLIGGIATIAQVYLNRELVLESDSMFAAHSLDVTDRLRPSNELAIRCAALRPLLAQARRPRARWRTRLVADGNLRFYRTMLLGRAPGFAPGPAAVGPWRAVALGRRRQLAVEALELRPRLDGADGVLAVTGWLHWRGLQPAGVQVELDGPSGAHSGALELRASEDADGGGERLALHGQLRVPDVARWWPHTHGEPSLHDVRLRVSSADGSILIDAGRVGFRELAFGADGHDLQLDGLDLRVNGVGVFARGAVWTPIDPVGLAPKDDALREALERVRAAGMNMLRLPGTGAYESSAFHDLCDELGIMVWQDFMFANLDYPIGEESFRAAVEREAASVLDALGGRPSLVVLCGNSEVEQQVAMLGLGPELGRGELFGELLPALVRDSGVDAAYVPSSPSGGELPFRPGRGIANYYGVGGYMRPLTDARLAGVRFAAECLAFANVPGETTIEHMAAASSGALSVNDPAWKTGVPRDRGASWDFEDVRDHYLGLVFDLDPRELRRVDQGRYLELSRAVTGEVMAAVFGEWRRSGSPCGGGLVLWLQDLVPGAGWGVIDARAEPKVAYCHLRRALAPVAVWMVDEGLGGVVAHVANDGPAPLTAELRLAFYDDLEQRVGEVREQLDLGAHDSLERNVESLLGRFVDASWAYRFGPPAQDAIVASLEASDGGRRRLLSQSFHFPAGRPSAREGAASLGLQASASPLAHGNIELALTASRLAWGVRMHVPGFTPDDDAFSIEPGGARTVILRPREPDARFTGGALTALNLDGRVRVGSQGDGGAEARHR
jgi:beta-mannosidase